MPDTALKHIIHLPEHKHWNETFKGTGQISMAQEGIELSIENRDKKYSNAQIDDYRNLARREFLWHPPLSLEVKSHFSRPTYQANLHSGIESIDKDNTPLLGTAGIGFWNDPFLMTGLRTPSLPKALWFFYASPPSNMHTSIDLPGYGFKAATIDAWKPAFLKYLPAMPLMPLLSSIPSFLPKVWPKVERSIACSEKLLTHNICESHTYKIDWLENHVDFHIDADKVFTSPYSIKGPLGLVIWLDNQYLRLTPRGQFSFGSLSLQAKQSLFLDSIKITTL
ncbi:MAG: hypothetical protein HQL32_07960 [Planctomycetes bacterium]|nr:hypothetical protein [Planctomycetota bacterium]